MDRDELLALVKQRDEIEQELNDLGTELKTHGDVGMAGELVDREGYPRYVSESDQMMHSLSSILETISIFFAYGKFGNE